jgi:DhnA family fructose-bisphosphate aldolase class Ia
MGRQIFGHPNPEKMAAAIVAIVHHGLSADDALNLLS